MRQFVMYLRTQTLISITVAFPYPIMISDVDPSSFVNKTPYSVTMPPLSCHVQGSVLMERNEHSSNMKEMKI